jgi:predicted nucleic-acid-binding protein
VNHECIDTNVLIRFLVETPETINFRFQSVFQFFARLENGDISAQLPDVVLFQSFFVLTSHYKVPERIAAEKLEQVVQFKGILMSEKQIAIGCLRILQKENVDIVDAWILAFSSAKGLAGVYSFDADFPKRGLPLLRIG